MPLAPPVLLAQAIDQLSAQNVDLAVEDAPLVGDLGLFCGQLLNQGFQLDILQRAEVGERLHRGLSPLRELRRAGRQCWTRKYRPKGQAELESLLTPVWSIVDCDLP